MDIDVKGVVKHFDGTLVKALNGVSFSVKGGELVSLLGPSGSGKSTLLNIVSTMDRQTEGLVHFDNKNIRTFKPLDRFRAKHIGFVFQFHHLIPHLSLVENVELPMMVFEKSRKARRDRARLLLARMGLSAKENSFPNRISGGERQRGAIARALANHPGIILADEPTGNVDTQTGQMVMSFIIAYCREHAATLIMATHNQEMADMTDRKIYLKNGLIEER